MSQLRYPLVFALVIVVLTVATLAAYERISEKSLGTVPELFTGAGDTTDPAPRFGRARPADVEAFADQDSAWREQHARPFTLAELRARGDGRRSQRQLMQDRVYQSTQRGNRAQAIAELQRWVASNPRDGAALLSLARLLSETGRTDESVRRYRQLLALQERGRQ